MKEERRTTWLKPEELKELEKFFREYYNKHQSCDDEEESYDDDDADSILLSD